MSRDTWAYDYQNPVELNRYVYVHNNPVNYVDPSGNMEFAINLGARCGSCVKEAMFYGTVAVGLFAIVLLAMNWITHLPPPEKTTSGPTVEEVAAAFAAMQALYNRYHQANNNNNDPNPENNGWERALQAARKLLPGLGLCLLLCIGGEPQPQVTPVPTTQEATGTPAAPTPSPTPDNQLKYVTYTLTHPITGVVYSGRARGYGTPNQIVQDRYIGHHMIKKGYTDPPVLDQWKAATLPYDQRWDDPAYQAIRGREQQLIDAYGRSISDGGTSGNSIRGVAKRNPLGRVYHNAANAAFGQLYPYTGY